MQKLEYLNLENKKKFNIYNALEKAINCYNNTIHSIIKIEPSKAFKFIQE